MKHISIELEPPNSMIYYDLILHLYIAWQLHMQDKDQIQY